MEHAMRRVVVHHHRYRIPHSYTQLIIVIIIGRNLQNSNVPLNLYTQIII